MIDPSVVELLSKDVLDDYLNKEFASENGKYTGERVNGKRSGTGTYTWNDGSVYEGEFANDQINGEGKLTIPGKGTYDGEFVNGKKSGTGTYEFVNGDKYVGNWSNDVMSGYGTYTFSNGDKYVGQFSDNIFAKNPNGYRCKIYKGILDILFDYIENEEAVIEIFKSWIM